MKYTQHTNKLLGESYFSAIHNSGLEVVVIPKKQMTAYALFATRYGSVDNTFKTKKDGDFIKVPDGIAHFLEHKLFENDDGSDTFSRFAELGASANAYTSNDMTAYLFSATENYYESLEVLLDFVTHPYFTEKTVEKEMGIIEQELRMYEDNPYRWLYHGLLESLYVENNVRINVGGTVDSIHEITADILYDCYNTFYNPSNMVLIISGDVELDKVSAVVDKVIPEKKDSFIEKKVQTEPERVNKEYVEKSFPIAYPMFHIGLKEVDYPKDDLYIKRELEHSIICELLFGKTSDFYTKLYNEGLINQKFGTSYYASNNWGHFIASGESENPKRVFELIKKEIELFRNGVKEIDKDAFERAKRVLYSSSVQMWNSTTDIAEAFLDYYMAGANMLHLPEVLSTVTIGDIKKRLKVSYNPLLMSMAVAVPLDEEK